MLFKRVSRNQPETMFAVVKNVSGSTMTAGYWVAWDTSGDADGVRVSQQAAAALGAVAGVSDADLADSAYGLIQVYGYRASGYVYSSTGSSAVGDILFPKASSWAMVPYVYAAAAAGSKGFGFLCTAVTTSASSSLYHTSAEVFIRCLG